MMPIEESIGLLSKFDPTILKQLKSRFPEYGDQLRPGQLAGETPERRSLAAEITISACNRTSQLSSDLATFLRRRLDISSKLEYLTQLLSLLTSGSLLGLIVSDASISAKYTAAILSFISSIASLAAKFLSRTLTTGASSATEIFAELLEIKPRAEGLRDQVRLWSLDNSPKGNDDIQALVAKGNELSGRIFKLASVVPGFATSIMTEISRA